MFTHRNSVQGRWTDRTWMKYPLHEIEKRDPLPQYIYDLEPFMEKKADKRYQKERTVIDTLRHKEDYPDMDNLVKSKLEYLDPRYVQKYKDEKGN